MAANDRNSKKNDTKQGLLNSENPETQQKIKIKVGKSRSFMLSYIDLSH